MITSGSNKPLVLKPVRPNVGIERAFQERLEKLIVSMHRSIVYWITAQYREKPPEMANDASSARELLQEMRMLGRRWIKKFNEAADKLSNYFTGAMKDRSDTALKKILRDAGISVEFKMTPEMNDVMQATIADQAGLIKSIASKHISDVQGDIMRSVQVGGDLQSLTQALTHRYGVTRRRAETIAQHQNGMATASMTRVRQQALGIETAKWLHSGGKRHPRKEHVEFSMGKHSTGGPIYEVRKGAFLEGKWTWPGYEINCGCVSRPIIEGFS